jgi:ubiquitin-like-conjugating enzyme ATG10
MFRTALLQCQAQNRDIDLVEEEGGLESGDIIDDPAVARDASSGFLTCGQSIAFSPTFQVPVFYFTVHDSCAYSRSDERAFC